MDAGQDAVEGLHPKAVVLTAALSCLLTSGLAFGFSALIPSLVDFGAFREDCQHHAPCHAQRMALVWVFVLGTSASALSTLPQGILMDYWGPRACGVLFGAAVALGCFLFSLSGSGLWRAAYSTGFVLMAVGGSGVFVSTVSFCNLFPRHAGLIIATLVACFDASSGIFQALAFLISLGVGVPTVFRLYAVLSAFLATAAGLYWPTAPVVVSDKKEDEADLKNSDFWSKAKSLDFALFTYTMVVDVLCANFFLVTVYPRVLSVTPNTAKMLNSAFAVLLPAGAIIYAPLIGYLLNQWGPAMAFLVFDGVYVVFAQMLMMLHSETATCGYCIWVVFLLFTLCRPMLYAVANGLCGELFGYQCFGQIYGLVMTLAGVGSFLAHPLADWADSGNFLKADRALLLLQVSTVALPVRVLWRQKSGLPLSELEKSTASKDYVACPQAC